MWRNLAKVQSTIQTIGNVVAPALSDGEDEDDSDFDEDDDEGNGGLYSGGEAQDERQGEAATFTNQYSRDSTQYRSNEWRRDGDQHNALEQQQHDSDSHEPAHSGRHRGFGLVGLIAKALDGAAEGSDDDDDDGDEDGEEIYQEQAAHEDRGGYGTDWRFGDSHAREEEQIQFEAPFRQSEDRPEESRLELEPEPMASSPLAPSSASPAPVNDDDSPPAGRVTPVATTALASTLMLDSTSEHNPMRLADPDQLPHPRPFGLVREGGSVSPFGSPASIRSNSQSNGAGAGGRNLLSGGLPTTHEYDDDADSTEESIFGEGAEEGVRSGNSRRLDDVSPPDRGQPGFKGIEAPSDQPPPLEPLGPVFNVAPPPPLYAEPSSPKASSSLTHSSSLNVAQRPDIMPEPLPATISVVPDDTTAILSSAAQDPAPVIDVTREEPVEYSRPPFTDQPNSTAVAPIVSAVPERNSSTSTVAPSPMVNGPLQQQPQQLERERKLERRCRELEDRLMQAEARTQVLEDAAALSKVALAKSERDAMDRLREEFQEKEARLLSAAAEDHEQELRFLKNDAEIQVQSLRQEMAQERDVFEREREYFEQLVAEANARAEQAERQFQRERTRQESTMSQSQKQHDREVQMRAEKLAETMALLDEREDKVSKLKALVQSLQSKLNEHAEGAQLAEDEVEELHHENEELRQAVQRLDVTCKDLQKKNSELHADSNKLSELKVRTGI
jgi:hypothetical protein